MSRRRRLLAAILANQGDAPAAPAGGPRYWTNHRNNFAPSGLPTFPGDGANGDPAVAVLSDSSGVYPIALGPFNVGWMAQNNNGSNAGIANNSEHLRGSCGMTAAVSANTMRWNGLTPGKTYEVIVVVGAVGIAATQSFEVRTASGRGGTLITGQAAIALDDPQAGDTNGNKYTTDAAFMAAVASGAAAHTFVCPVGVTDIYITKGGNNARLMSSSLKQMD